MVYAADAQQGTAQRARESSGGVQDVCAGTVPVCVCVECVCVGTCALAAI